MESPRVRKLLAFEFLCDNRLGVLSSISPDQLTPKGSLIYYVVDEKNIYFVTTTGSRKVKNLAKNNKISFTVFSEIPPFKLQIEGTVQLITDQDKKSHISKIYMENANKNPDTINWPPVLKLPHDEGFKFMKITVEHFKYSDFSEKESRVVEGTPLDWA